ncbi:MAG: peptidylprolyl isomerase [Thermodesulfobacteriota bacterium]
MKRWFVVSFFVLGLSILWIPSVFSEEVKASPDQATEGQQKGKEVVATVNGIEITEYDLMKEVEKTIPTLYHDSTRKKEGKLKTVRRNALEKLILDELKYQKAKTEKIKVDKREVEKRVERIRKRFPGGKLEEILKKNNLTMTNLEEGIRRNLLIKALDRKMEKKLEDQAEDIVDDAYILNYYNNNKDKFKMPERFRLREILIKADPGAGRKGREEAWAVAEGLKKRVQAGEDFAELAREYSKDMYAEKGGDVGLVHKGSIAAEVGNAVMDMKVGELGGPIGTLYGYHVIRLEERVPAIQLEFHQITKQRLETELVEKEYDRLEREWREGLKKDAKIKRLMNDENN